MTIFGLIIEMGSWYGVGNKVIGGNKTQEVVVVVGDHYVDTGMIDLKRVVLEEVKQVLKSWMKGIGALPQRIDACSKEGQYRGWLYASQGNWHMREGGGKVTG